MNGKKPFAAFETKKEHEIKICHRYGMTKDDIRVYEERTRVLLEQLRQSDATPEAEAGESGAAALPVEEVDTGECSTAQPKSCW